MADLKPDFPGENNVSRMVIDIGQARLDLKLDLKSLDFCVAPLLKK